MFPLRPGPTPVHPVGYQLGLRRVPGNGRPWVMTNMVMSLDGAIAVEGRSGPLGSRADRDMFHALRLAADAILVGAGTVRAERYRLPTAPAELIQARRDHGLPDHPRLAIVSGSLDFPTDLPAFTVGGPGPPPLIYTAGEVPAPTGRVEVHRLEGDHVDPVALLADLGRRGHRVVLCEGGPTLLGTLLDRDLIDEYCVTFSPTLVGGADHGAVRSPTASPRPFRRDSVVEGDGTLLVRYLRDRESRTPADH